MEAHWRRLHRAVDDYDGVKIRAIFYEFGHSDDLEIPVTNVKNSPSPIEPSVFSNILKITRLENNQLRDRTVADGLPRRGGSAKYNMRKQ